MWEQGSGAGQLYLLVQWEGEGERDCLNAAAGNVRAVGVKPCYLSKGCCKQPPSSSSALPERLGPVEGG